MKILIVINMYPPHHHGGYELRCAQVAEYLQREGHHVRVVTSRYEMSGTTHKAVVREDVENGVEVARFLRQHRLDPRQPGGRSYNLDCVRQQIVDIERFGRVLDEFAPDVVNWWNLEGLTKAILRMPEDRGIPSVHCIDDGWIIEEFGRWGAIDSPFWFEFWQVKWGPRALRPLVRRCLRAYEQRQQRNGVPTRAFDLPPAHMCFISAFWKARHLQAGFDVRSSEVIYGGVSPEKFFVPRAPAEYADGPLRLLYAGYVNKERGLHTIVEALGLLPESSRHKFHLSIAAGGPAVPDAYVTGIHERIERLGLKKHVTFLGRVSHEDMPAVYASNHVLVFASTRNEGMPMVMMEAMCAGCAAPNTGSGGAIELADRAGTPLFPKDHPFALSRLLTTLEQDRRRVAEIAMAGQQTVLREFTLQQMLASTRDALIAQGKRRWAAAG
jgi:glycogen(starch) synthase